MAGEILGRRADRYARLEHLQADVGPFADGLEVYAAVDEGLGEIAAAGAKSVGANGHWTWDFVCFEELDCLVVIQCRISQEEGLNSNVPSRLPRSSVNCRTIL